MADLSKEFANFTANTINQTEKIATSFLNLTYCYFESGGRVKDWCRKTVVFSNPEEGKEDSDICG
jgi:ATP phosphoribosyltransferase